MNNAYTFHVFMGTSYIGVLTIYAIDLDQAYRFLYEAYLDKTMRFVRIEDDIQEKN